jgi:excisionase family DNA binding protein
MGTMSDLPATDLALLQIKDVAALAKVCPKTVRRWIAANQIAVVHLGRSVRISQAELARFIAARTSNNENNRNK